MRSGFWAGLFFLGILGCLIWEPGCGSGGGIAPTPSIKSVAVSPAPTSVEEGKTATFTATVAGTGNYSSAVSWSASAGTITAAGVFTAPNAPGTVTVKATSTQDSTKLGSASVTVVTPLAVSVSPATATVKTDGTVALAATITGGTGKATVAWTVVGGGTVAPASGLTTTYTAPATAPSPTTIVITATATDSTGSATATVSITVQRVITISTNLSLNLTNNGIHSDYGTGVPVQIDCTGCQTGDTLNVLETTIPYAGVPWTGILNFTGIAFIPGLIKIWATGADGAVSNNIYFTFNGGSMIGYTDPSTGKMYYYNSGGGSPSTPGTI